MSPQLKEAAHVLKVDVLLISSFIATNISEDIIFASLLPGAQRAYGYGLTTTQSHRRPCAQGAYIAHVV
jgi:hypothetical protein